MLTTLAYGAQGLHISLFILLVFCVTQLQEIVFMLENETWLFLEGVVTSLEWYSH